MELNPEQIRILLCGVGIGIYLLLKVMISANALAKFSNTVIAIEFIYLGISMYTNSYSSSMLELIAIGIILSHMLEDGKKEKKKREGQES